MLNVTEPAIINVKEYLSREKTESPVRIFMMSGGCSGPSLGLALDKAKETDLTFEQDGISFLVAKELAETCGAITVDFRESGDGCGCSGGGFSITSEKPIAGDGCGCSCTSNSCC